MEISAPSLSQPKLPCCSTSLSPSFHFASNLVLPFHCSNYYGNGAYKLKFDRIKSKGQRNLGVVYASEGDTTSTDATDRWILEPAGDGDTRHIGFKVQMPDAFEIASSDVTVGRLPDKADVVIPVATVSGIHARIQKKGGDLLVTDLDSTNGTFINDQRLRPGVVNKVPPGSFLIFGDIHLAMFRVSKLENVESSGTKPEESADKSETDTATTEATSTD